MKRRTIITRALQLSCTASYSLLAFACSKKNESPDAHLVSGDQEYLLQANHLEYSSSHERSGNIIVGGGAYSSNSASEERFVIAKVKLDALSLSTKFCSFLPHGFHRNPKRQNILAVFEKKGPGALIYDVAAHEIVRTISPTAGRHFYGHGAYTVDGDSLFATETDLASRKGVISIRDAITMAELGEFPSYGVEPHECKLIDEGKTLVVTNGGGPTGHALPNVAYIDVASQRLLERVELSSQRVNTGHLAVTANGGLIVVSAPRAGMDAGALGGVSLRSAGQRLLETASGDPRVKKMFGEALSVCVHEASGVALVTHPGGDMLSFWSVAQNKLIHSIALDTPRGVELNREESAFIVSYGAQANLIKIDIDGLALDPNSLIPSTYLTGSHIYNWSRDMQELHYPGPQV